MVDSPSSSPEGMAVPVRGRPRELPWPYGIRLCEACLSHYPMEAIGRPRGPSRLVPLLCALLCASACPKAAPPSASPRPAPLCARTSAATASRGRLCLRGGGCGTGGGGCGTGGGGCGSGACAPRESETPEPDWALEDGPGDLQDAESSSAPPPPPPRDMQLAAKEQQALVLEDRRQQRELAKQAVKRRAEGSLSTDNFDSLVKYFVTSWLQIQLFSCWRPIFEALQSGIGAENELGPLTRKDLRRVVESGLEILDEDLLELQVIDLKEAPDYVAPSAEEVDRRVARYMSLDTNGDGVIDLQEFSVRFLSYCREAMYESVDDDFRREYERDPLFVEEDLSQKLIEFDERMQNDVRPLLKLIDEALWRLRTPEERAAAMILHTPFEKLTPYDIIEVVRPWDTLVDVGENFRRLHAPLYVLSSVHSAADFLESDEWNERIKNPNMSQGKTVRSTFALPKNARLGAGGVERLRCQPLRMRAGRDGIRDVRMLGPGGMLRCMQHTC